MQRIIVFDVETKHTFDEVGGFENRDKLGISYVGVYSYTQGQYYGFVEEDLHKLEKILIEEKPMMIGFNSIHFDCAVLQPYFPNLDLAQLPQLDMLREVEKTLGHRLKLDSIATTTLYHGKTGDGLDAVRWYRQGKMAELAQYCIDDVVVTKEVYEFGLRHGKIYYMTGGQKTAVDISWGVEPTIEQLITEAFKRHKQARVVYMNATEISPGEHTVEKVPYTIDVLGLEGDRIEAFVQELQEKKVLSISQIWECDVTEESSAHQVTMF